MKIVLLPTDCVNDDFAGMTDAEVLAKAQEQNEHGENKGDIFNSVEEMATAWNCGEILPVIESFMRVIK